MTKLHQLTATEAVAALRRKDVSPKDLVDASVSRIEAVDGKVNALPIRDFERALERACDPELAQMAPLHGLPIAVKDYNDVGGVRTTYGSPIYADHVPEHSDATVSMLESRGALPIAKSNVPEWAGGHTFNPVNGTTRNPWNLALSAGGSSGGSAAALASGQVSLATGNDLGGSLRTPASFNGIVGLRPGPGVVPRGKRLQAFDTLWVEGPMGRCVRDIALMLDAGAGAHPHDPYAFDAAGASFVDALEAADQPARIGFSANLGIVPMSREVAGVCKAAAVRLAETGVEVTDEAPDFSGALEGFQTLRAVLLATMMGPLLAEHRDRINPDIIKNVERGLHITPEQIFEAERARWQLFHRVSEFFETHDLLICPAVSVTPFPVETPFVTEIDGKPCETYIDWFAITFALTMTGCPVLSLPCGFTDAGMPVGLQIMGKPRGEAALLRAALRFEECLGVASGLPIDPRGDG
ncbi:MAG: amidase family protein [Pseudomonadota bacterium]